MARRPITVEDAIKAPSFPATLTRMGSGGRTLGQSKVAFGTLASAFAISALYQAYRGTLMEIPEDAFTASTAAIYVAEVGVSALVLTDKRWAWWLVSGHVVLNLAVGPLYYFPVVATKRDMGTVDWLEATAYIGLLSVAGSVCALRLLGARLAPKEG